MNLKFILISKGRLGSGLDSYMLIFNGGGGGGGGGGVSCYFGMAS